MAGRLGGRSTRIALAAALVVGAVVLAVVARAWLRTPLPTPSPVAGSTPMPTASITCTGEATPLPSILASDPCPGAVLAVQFAVAPVRLPIERLAIEPGPFYCDVLWPGVGTPPPCFGGNVRPGQYMHAWVAFRGSDEVAAVMLGLDLPDDLGAPDATRPPWHATLVTVEAPPAAWVMP